jgi:alpha-amylase
MGFDAIWISPIPVNAPADYHGYGALDWEKVNPHFGTSSELTSLIKACHDRDVWVMLDVVANHSSYYHNEDFSNINPLNKAEYYHTRCDIDWNNQWSVENCWLSGLPDLDQSNEYVRTYLKSWIKKTVSDFDFDGIRIDTIPEVPKPFWSEYTAAAGVFQMGECFNQDPAFVGDYQNHVAGLFNYPMFYTIKDVFGSGQSMNGLKKTLLDMEDKSKDVDALGVFVDNHDNGRFLSYFNDRPNQFKSALIFALTTRGIPFFYYGDEQGFSGGSDPACRESLWTHMDTSAEIYQMVAKVNKARKAERVWEYGQTE